MTLLTFALKVHKLLTSKLGACDNCWTSDLRTHYGLPAFEDHESHYTDFTITDPDVCDRITQWLIEAENNEAYNLLGKTFTYRMEVKATTGGCDEPFSMSANQYNQVFTHFDLQSRHAR